MDERKDAECRRTPRYIVFTVGGTDVLVSVSKRLDEECPSDEDVAAMQIAADGLALRKERCSAKEIVEHALQEAGYEYDQWFIHYVGEICRVEL